MNVPPAERSSLWRIVTSARAAAAQTFYGAGARVAAAELGGASILDGRLDELCGRSVLLAVKDQLTAALALIELDGIARRITLCPPDLPQQHLPAIAAKAAAEVAICGHHAPPSEAGGIDRVFRCSPAPTPADRPRRPACETEWILLTSGTTGLPKLVVHTLSSLTAAIKPGVSHDQPVVWSTFYDIRRYGGLQIFLRAVLGGSSLVLSSAEETTGDFLIRAGGRGITHISGTPSHWRRALMSPQAHRIAPRYVRLSGEIADQAVLDHLRAAYPDAGVGHAFASTEAGVAFEVNDGLAGFPAALIGSGAEVEIKVADGSLRIRSPRTASGYLGLADKQLLDRDGYVDTGDMVEQRGKRFYFAGRADGVINVGGRKVHPEEVEAVINRHPAVRMSLVKSRRNPITGAVVVADVVLRPIPGEGAASAAHGRVQAEIIAFCRGALAAHKVPAAIRLVPALPVTASGKLARFDA
jgi:acyl-coenzyme A synthetase/AMP-(fatty) acid ligase